MKRVALGLAATLALLLAAGLWLAQSDWLREKIRREVVRQAEVSTGGRVELGQFSFDWKTLTAEFHHLVVHGKEPAGQAPLLSIEKAVVGLQVTSLLARDIRVRSLTAERPAAHLIIYPDGSTNIPKPKVPGKSPNETILDLKIATFDLRGGAVEVARQGEPRQIIPWSARGENLAVHATYDVQRLRYTGDIALAPLLVNWQERNINARLTAHASMERDRISIASAHVEAEGAVVDLTDGVFNGTLTAKYRGHYASKLASTQVQVEGTSEGSLRFTSPTDYLVAGSVHGQARGIKGEGQLEATPRLITIRDARVNAYGGEATVNVELRNFELFHAQGSLHGIHLKTLPLKLPYDGYISGAFEAAGNLRHVTSGNLRGEISGPAAKGQLNVSYTGSKIEFGHTWIELPHTRVDLAGTLGELLNVELVSSDILDFAPLLTQVPGDLKANQIAFRGTVSGPLKDPRVVGHVAARGLAWRNQTVDSITPDLITLDSITGDLAATKDSAALTQGAATYGGISFDGSASVALTDWKPADSSAITATLETVNADLTKILVVSGHKEIELTGTLNATARVTGTLGDPHAAGDVALSHGFIYGQPFDSITGRVQVLSKTSQTLEGLFVSGTKRVNINAGFEHAGTRFPAGRLEFNLTSNTMPLNQIALVRKQEPDIRGFGKFHADGSLRISHDTKHDLQFDLLSLNADASANSLELTGRDLGDARFTAQTKDGVLSARFDSNAANALIHGEGTMRLEGDYPADGTIRFSNAGLNALATLVAKPQEPASLNFDGTMEGRIALRGPMKHPEALSAEFDVDRLEVHPLNLPDFSVTNSGPIRGVIANQTVRIQSAKLKAPQTDLTVDGTATLNARSPMNLQLRGTVNLALARTFIPDLASSGTATLDAALKGDWTAPDFAGRATIRGGDFHYADLTNGLTNAQGELVFNGTRATIQSFTAESGGGKVDVTGFATLTKGALAFRVEANAHAVRVRYPEGVSSVSDAHLTLAGTPQRSQASGLVMIHRVAINPKSDAASILASTASPARSPAVRTGMIENVNLDIQVETAPDVTLETSVTQTIQADANLRLRGTVSNPAILGRINITQGELIFFGNKYSINQGAISFYNPVKIDPILNVDLETKARGVDVILTVSGPVDKLNVSYRSDPPLQFSDIVALLATGRTPGDPTSAVRSTGQAQSFQQLGASALLGQAIANPVAGRLQRFFGVSRLKIDPQLTGITGSPQARLTIEQQVTPDILFTYITDVSSTSTQLIRVEWAYNRHWSAILTREENGYVGLDFAYKKSFR